MRLINIVLLLSLTGCSTITGKKESSLEESRQFKLCQVYNYSDAMGNPIVFPNNYVNRPLVLEHTKLTEALATDCHQESRINSNKENIFNEALMVITLPIWLPIIMLAALFSGGG